jgi:hypothetical protein
MDNLYEHRKLARKRIIHHARLTDVIKQIPLTTDKGKEYSKAIINTTDQGNKVLH